MNIQKQITNEFINKISNNLDKILLDGLKLKGYTFESKSELEQFIKEHCFCADDLKNQQKTYYVKNIPFLLHCYKSEIKPIIKNSNGISISAELGFYKFL